MRCRSISIELLNQLREEYKTSGNEDISLARWIIKQLENRINKRKLLQKLEPDIKIEAVADNLVILSDPKSKFIEVIFRGLEPYCYHCSKVNCRHAYYALAAYMIYGRYGPGGFQTDRVYEPRDRVKTSFLFFVVIFNNL